MHQVAVESSRWLVDRHLVVVEHHEQVAARRCSRIVKTLEG